MEQNTIYKVVTEGDVEGRSMQILGYCTGEKRDIEAYFQDQKTYALSIEPIKVVNITPESTSNKEQLLKRKKEIENELQRIKDQLY